MEQSEVETFLGSWLKDSQREEAFLQKVLDLTFYYTLNT